MRKALLITIMLVVLFTALLINADQAKLPSQTISATQQQQTLNAVVQQRLSLTQTALAVTPPTNTPTAMPSPDPKVATAQMEATIASALDAALTATAESALPTIVGRVGNGQSVNLRACPTTTCAVVDVLQPGTEVTLVGQVPDWFYAISVTSQGYVFSSLVIVDDPALLASLPPPPPTPTPSPIPSATPDISLTATFEALGPLVAPRSDGYYLVGVDIVPGRWETQGVGGSCYWQRVDRFNETIDNHFGEAGGTITIQPSDFAINVEDCGRLIYVENRPSILLPTAYDTKESGFYTVGVEIAPGSWRSNGQGGGCYWARLDRFQEINDNYYGNAGAAIYIIPGDYEVRFSDCGQWEYIGP